MEKEKIRIILVEDLKCVLESLTKSIQEELDFEIVGTALDGNETIRLVKTIPFDVLLLDIEMKFKNGFEVLEEIQALKVKNPKLKDIKILMYSAFNSYKEIDDAAEKGAFGFISKYVGLDELFRVIRKAYQGDYPACSSDVQQFWRGGEIIPPKIKRNFTEFEKRLFHYLVRGLTSKEIATQTKSKKFAIDAAIRNIKKKLKVENSIQMINEIRDNGWA